MAVRADRRDPAGGLVPLALLLTATVGVLLALTTGTGDYVHRPPGARAIDDAAPAVHALLHGDLAGFAAGQPAMGLTSLILRLPFAGAARAFGGGLGAEYRLGALACLLVAAAVCGLVGRAVLRRGAGRWVAALVAVLPLANPVTVAALRTGHPEDLLAAALCVAAVLAAARRPALAGALLGAAIATKPWGVLGAPALLLALPASARLRAAGAGAVVALALAAPGPLLSPHDFGRSTEAITTVDYVTPQSLWWPVADRITDPLPFGGSSTYLRLPGGLDRRGISLALALAAALGFLGLRRRERDRAAALLVLALLMLAREVLDPAALDYYGAPLLLALGGLGAARPALAARALVVVAAGLELGVLLPGAGMRFGVTVAWSLALAAALAGELRAVPAPTAVPARAAA